jgi:hypothetical protein
MKTTRKDEYVYLNPTRIDYRGLCAACAMHSVDQEGWLCLTCALNSAAYRITRPVITGRGLITIVWGQEP